MFSCYFFMSAIERNRRRFRRDPVFKAKNYVKAESLEEAYQLNQKKSTLVIGGMLWVKMSGFHKMTIVDLSGLGLDKIEESEEEFKIGCMCTLRELEMHEGLNRSFKGLMKECTRHIVGVQFRNGATVGGSIFGRYGFSDILTAFLALDTYVELYKGGIIPLKEFAALPYDNDILIRLIVKKDGRKPAYLSQRQTQTDFPLIAVCAAKKEDIWYVTVGARPARAELCEVRNSEDKEALAKAVVSRYSFGTNLRGSKEYRQALAEIYVKRLMKQIEEEA